MNKSQKLNKLKEVLPLFWNSYQHIFDVRDRNGQFAINFLLIVTTFLPILCATLYTSNLFHNIIILFPIIFQITALLILLRSFLLPIPAMHWFKLDEELKNIREGRFELDLIATLKSLESVTYINLEARRPLIRYSVFLIIFSLFSMFLSIIFIALEGSLVLYILTLVVMFIFCFFFYKFLLKQPKYNFEEDCKKYRKQLKDWLDK